MKVLSDLYGKLRVEMQGNLHLMSCKELYNSSSYKDEISERLKYLGFECPRNLEYILFFMLVDEVGVSDVNGQFNILTLSNKILMRNNICGSILSINEEFDPNTTRPIAPQVSIPVLNKFLEAGKVVGVSLATYGLVPVSVYEDYYLLSNLNKWGTVSRIMTSILKFGNTYVTLSKDVLERFYGTSYMGYESQANRENFCLYELYQVNGLTDINYFITKYKFFNDDGIRGCRNTFDLRYLLRQRVLGRCIGFESLEARVLMLRGVSSAYYSYIDLNKDYVVVKGFNKMLLNTYRIGASTNLGYETVDVRAESYEDAIEIGKESLEEKYGDIFSNKILGVQLGTEVYANYDPVFMFSTDSQMKLCNAINLGYLTEYRTYSTLFRDILGNIVPHREITDDMIKLLFINRLAYTCGDAKNVSLGAVGYFMEQFIVMVMNNTDEAIQNMINSIRRKSARA